MDYSVDLEVYSGPLDLLLYLIREQELEIHNIPVAAVARQYVAHLETLRDLDINVAGEFLVMASTLMEIKSKMLPPVHDEEEDEEEPEDPRADLVRRLVEYKRFRDFAGLLRDRARDWSRSFTRGREYWIEQESAAEDPLVEADVWGLVKAYSSLLKQTLADVTRRIVRDDTPIRVHADRILARLRGAGKAVFSELVEGETDRGSCAGIFLAVLELVKQRQVHVIQAEIFGPIEIVPTPHSSE